MKHERLKFIITTISGNVMEWYDFALYGYFATVIAKLFFPSQDIGFSLLMTFGAFASGFIARPIGGVIFGHIGDRYGRRVSLLISISLIVVPTALIGFLPSYASIGIAAPILLTVLRILQGIAVSGELTGSGIFLMECAPEGRRGFYGSLVMCSTYLGLLIGAAVSLLISLFYSDTEILNFAWRIPFLISFVFGLCAILSRLKCRESPVFKAIALANNIIKMPVVHACKQYLPAMVCISLTSSLLAVAIYLLIGYFPSYFIMNLKMTIHQAMAISFGGLLILTLCVPIMGRLVDREGAYKIFSIGTGCFLLSAPVIFELLTREGINSAVACVALTSSLLSLVAAAILPIIASVFPANVRCSGVSIGYNFSMSLFGGTTPLIAMMSCQYMGVDTAPTMYLALAAVVSLLGLYFLSRTTNQKTASFHLERFEMER